MIELRDKILSMKSFQGYGVKIIECVVVSDQIYTDEKNITEVDYKYKNKSYFIIQLLVII